MNRVYLTGNITRQPEVKYMSNGSAVANFGLAINERWTDKETGELRESVCFVDVEAWGRQAELIHEYFRKGSGILLEGSLKFDAWKADDGTNRNRLKVRLQRFEFMGPRTDTMDESEMGDATPESESEQPVASDTTPF